MAAWLSFLVLAVCCQTGLSQTWPPDEIAVRSPEMVAAGRRAAAQIACEVCRGRLTGLLQNRDKDELQDSLEGEGYYDFEEQLSSTKVLCNMKKLAKLFFRDLKWEVQALPNAPAVLKATENGTVPLHRKDVSMESLFHWKSFAVEQACVEVFRRGSELIASSFRKAFLSDNSTAGLIRIAIAGREACEQSQACRRQRKDDTLREKHRKHDLVLAAKALSRQEGRMEKDKAFQPSAADLDPPRAFEFDTLVDYYKVMGAKELSPHDEIERRCDKFKTMFTLHQTLSELGSKQPEKDSELRERREQVDAACAVLLHPPTRRQYDHERDSLDAAAEVGLKKRPLDKDSMDGRKILQEFDPAEKEL